jgi:hypothetical protein
MLVPTINIADTTEDGEKEKLVIYNAFKLDKHGSICNICYFDFYVMMYSEKALNPVQAWLLSFSALCHYPTFGMASIIYLVKKKWFDIH